MKIKDVGTLGKKWSMRAQAAVADYTAGAQGALQADAAIAAVGTWQQAVASPNAAKSYTTNLAKSGDAGWLAGVQTKGAARYGPGVAAGQNKWQAGVQPYLSALSSLALPPRGLKRSPQNMARVQAVVTAMANVKTGGA